MPPTPADWLARRIEAAAAVAAAYLETVPAADPRLPAARNLVAWWRADGIEAVAGGRLAEAGGLAAVLGACPGWFAGRFAAPARPTLGTVAHWPAPRRVKRGEKRAAYTTED